MLAKTTPKKVPEIPMDMHDKATHGERRSPMRASFHSSPRMPVVVANKLGARSLTNVHVVTDNKSTVRKLGRSNSADILLPGETRMNDEGRRRRTLCSRRFMQTCVHKLGYLGMHRRTQP